MARRKRKSNKAPRQYLNEQANPDTKDVADAIVDAVAKDAKDPDDPDDEENAKDVKRRKKLFSKFMTKKKADKK